VFCLSSKSIRIIVQDRFVCSVTVITNLGVVHTVQAYLFACARLRVKCQFFGFFILICLLILAGE